MRHGPIEINFSTEYLLKYILAITFSRTLQNRCCFPLCTEKEAEVKAGLIQIQNLVCLISEPPLTPLYHSTNSP